jgi:hypothetical protein
MEIPGYSGSRAADLQEEPTNESRSELILQHRCFVGFDEDGGFPGEYRSERSEPVETASLGERSNQECRGVVGRVG